MNELQGKVAIITGASSGIGRASVIRFAAEGCNVMAVARSEGELAETVRQAKAGPGQPQSSGTACVSAADFTQEGGRCMADNMASSSAALSGRDKRVAGHGTSAAGTGSTATASGQIKPIVADLLLVDDIARIVDETVVAFGGIDILVNAAGILKNGTIENTSLEDWERLMDLNVRAPFLLMQAAMPRLVERKGNVVNVSSVNGLRAFPNVLAYNVSKAALDQLTHCAALEMAAKGVRVNAVNPGVTVTGLHRNSGMNDAAYAQFLEHSKDTHPLGRVGRPEEIAELIYFLASPRAAWITGGSYSIDGGRGQTCLR